VVQQLKAKGVHFTGEVVRDKAGTFANLEGRDGTPIYLWRRWRCLLAHSPEYPPPAPRRFEKL
jgi:hypothetical protein